MTQTQQPHNSLDAEQVGYKQTLARRHVQMIAIGGAIGTGLFLGSASRLHSTGPALLFSYAFVGVIAYLLMRALGELVLHRVPAVFAGMVGHTLRQCLDVEHGFTYRIHCDAEGMFALRARAGPRGRPVLSWSLLFLYSSIFIDSEPCVK